MGNEHFMGKVRHYTHFTLQCTLDVDVLLITLPFNIAECYSKDTHTNSLQDIEHAL